MHRAHGRSLSWNGQRARLELATDVDGGPRGSIIPETVGATLAPVFITHCVEQLVAQGAATVVSPALTEDDAAGYRQAGFETTARLHLLTHDLRQIPADRGRRREPATARAARNRDDLLLAVDRAAFAQEWRLDAAGLRSAVTATPAVRVRVTGDASAPIGYAITGRAGRRGYLQRLGVDPGDQGQGHGRALVPAYCLEWCHRWRVRRVVVNTHEGNDRALALYRAMGFVPADLQLVVMTLSVASVGPVEGHHPAGSPATNPATSPAPPLTQRSRGPFEAEA